MSLLKKIACIGLMMTIGLSADEVNIQHKLSHFVMPYPASPRTIEKISREATPHEKQLIDYHAEQQLACEKTGLLKWYGQALESNIKYVATAQPFGIPYAWSIVAAGCLSYAIFKLHKRNSTWNQKDSSVSK